MGKIPEYKIINGKRYKLASQDMPKIKAKKLAKELRSPVKGLKTKKARIIPEPNPKKLIWKQGRYRVYTTKR